MKSNPNEFKVLGSKTLDLLSKYLEESYAGEGPTVVQQSPEDTERQLGLTRLIRNGRLNEKNYSDFLASYLDNSQHMHHPHYMGHQVAVPHPISGLSDLIHGVVNNPTSIYEMGPCGAVMEKLVINWMLEKIGWLQSESLAVFEDDLIGGGGVLTHGGSLANLTALLAARSQCQPESWESGYNQPLVILAPEVSHYSVSRAVSIMGMGSRAIKKIAVNDLEVLIPEDLERAWSETQQEGQKVMAVIANTCATSTGLYDPVEEIAHFCNEKNIWFHVDACHGAAALLSENEKRLMRGVELADSLVWDAHKMLQTSTLCAAVLVKDYKTLDNTFKQKGSYLFSENEKPGFDQITKTIECTKAPLGTKLFFAIANEGEDALGKHVEILYNKTKDFYSIINNDADFECLCLPESNILCFRYISGSDENSFQKSIHDQITLRANYYITSTTVKDKCYLRLTIMNPLTGEEHISGLLKEIKEIVRNE